MKWWRKQGESVGNWMYENKFAPQGQKAPKITQDDKLRYARDLYFNNKITDEQLNKLLTKWGTDLWGNPLHVQNTINSTNMGDNNSLVQVELINNSGQPLSVGKTKTKGTAAVAPVNVIGGW